jgi:ABC-type transport system involved in multi-copper enzyme maturation permease subunit
MSTNHVLSSGEASLAIARVAFLRVVRGRVVWVVAGLALLPIVFAILLKLLDAGDAWPGLVELWATLLVILPPVLLGGAIGEEIEEKTGTYLWCRPLPRWSIIVGKLVALVPALWVILTVSLMVPFAIFPDHGSDGSAVRVLGAVVLGTLAASAATAGIATLAPRWGTIIAIAYLLVIDRPLAFFDASISKISIAYHALCLAGVHGGESATEAVLWVLGLSTFWMGLALWRVRRME